MTKEAYCVFCSRRTPLVFDVVATDRHRTFAVYAYCDCGRIYEHEFFDQVGPTSKSPVSFRAKPISTSRIQIADLHFADDIDQAVTVHEFDLRDDDVYCEYHEAADGYDLPSIKQDIAERNTALEAMSRGPRPIHR